MLDLSWYSMYFLLVGKGSPLKIESLIVVAIRASACSTMHIVGI